MSKLSAQDKKLQLSKDHGLMMTKEIDDLCDLSQGIAEKANAQGLEQGTAKCIQTLSKTMNITYEEAMDKLVSLSKTRRCCRQRQSFCFESFEKIHRRNRSYHWKGHLFMEALLSLSMQKCKSRALFCCLGVIRIVCLLPI